ncbi:MAG: penicillin acylase family protein [Gammaproteobacteria bacterium]|nr:penicillin acylase family protein [Gammaproteobacteria bacterium]
MSLAVLDAPVTVKRDRYGIPYIYADTLADAIRVQGFVTAQDRLTQLLLTREAVNGRLAEIIGPRGLLTDLTVRRLGINRLARRFAAQLESPSRDLHEWYLQGINAYIALHADEFPLLIRLYRITPAPYTLEDICAHYLMQAHDLTENSRSEALAQLLVDQLGRARASEIALLSFNPDDGSHWSSKYELAADQPLAIAEKILATPANSNGGSNGWAVSGRRSARGAPILASDPHLNAQRLPGVWYPVALITPTWRAVGVAGVGWPGLAVGRSSHIAWGVTNSTADIADLFIEKEDPNREGYYLEGNRSHPYQVVNETIRIRDTEAPSGFREQAVRVRYTHRGPVVSDTLHSASDGHTVSLRWSVAENLGSQIGVDRLMLARDVFEAGESIRDIVGSLNYNVVDTRGNIAHFTSGHVPIRRRGDGAVPLPVVDGHDNWIGYVPFEKAPSTLNPERGWVGNANHRIVSGDFDGLWSSYSAPSWRYRRMLEILDNDRVLAAEDHWAAILDTRNTYAADITPILLDSLEGDSDSQAAAKMLREWNYHDEPDLAAPALFQVMIRRVVHAIFADELESAMSAYEGSLYFWQERVHRMLLDGDSDWFDDRNTPQRENLDDLVRRAARETWSELSERLGDDPGKWRWGDLGPMRFFSPAPVPEGWLNRLLGGGEYPRTGSPETLWGSFGSPYYGAWAIDSLRFVADLGDPDKVLAVVPGGVSDRLFDPHLNDQLPIWLSGEVNYWWFSDEAIAANKVREITLAP